MYPFFEMTTWVEVLVGALCSGASVGGSSRRRSSAFQIDGLELVFVEEQQLFVALQIQTHKQVPS